MQRFTSSRRGTLALGVMAALIAAALLLVYIAQYRNGVNSSSSTATVLVANRLIPQNSSGDVVASEKWFTIVQKPKSEVLSGAISDPSSIRGLVATHDIFPDQQLTANDFKTAPTDAVSYNLTGDERAIAIPLDSAHGLTPFIQAGDHVDILGGFDVIPIGTNGAPINSGGQARPVLKAIAQNVKVLDVPSSDSSATSRRNDTGNVVVQVTEQQAWDIDFATKNGTVFLAARGQTGATSSRPSLVTLETLLLGVPADQDLQVVRRPSVTGSVRVLVVLDPSVTGEQVMQSVPVDDVNVVGTIDDPREMLRALERTRADLLLLACDHGSDGIVQLIGEATRQRPGRPVLVLCAGAPNGFVRQVFEAGADDIVELPQSRESVRFLIEKAIARRQPSERAPARTVVVLGPKGGTGKTLTACNLGVLLANAGHRTVLVDIDLQFGDVGLALGLRPDRTIYDLASSGGTMDADQGQRLPDPA